MNKLLIIILSFFCLGTGFPTTPIIDNFNRSDEGPPPSSSWSTLLTGLAGGIEVTSNQLTVDAIGAGSIAGAYWNANSFDADQEIYLSVVTEPDFSVYLVVRGIDQDTVAGDGYVCRAGSSSTYSIYRLDDGSLTELEGGSLTLSNGDRIGCRAIGSTIQMYHYTSGAWSLVDTASDSTYSSGGNLAVFMDTTVGVYDDFGGGNYTRRIISN